MRRNRFLIALSPAILASLALSPGITTEALAASPPAAAAAATPSKAPMDGDNGDAGGGGLAGGDAGDAGGGGLAGGDAGDAGGGGLAGGEAGDAGGGGIPVENPNGVENNPVNDTTNNDTNNNVNNNINNINNNVNNNLNNNVGTGGSRVIWLVPSHPQKKCIVFQVSPKACLKYAYSTWR